MARQGLGYLGSKNVETSTVMHEVIPSPPIEKKWTHGYSVYKFNIMNFDACHIIINNETEIYLQAGQGFKMNEIDRPLTSFIIKEQDIRFQFIAAY